MKLKSVNRKTYFENKVFIANSLNMDYDAFHEVLNYIHENVLYVTKMEIIISLGVRKILITKRNDK